MLFYVHGTTYVDTEVKPFYFYFLIRCGARESSCVRVNQSTSRRLLYFTSVIIITDTYTLIIYHLCTPPTYISNLYALTCSIKAETASGRGLYLNTQTGHEWTCILNLNINHWNGKKCTTSVFVLFVNSRESFWYLCWRWIK